MNNILTVCTGNICRSPVAEAMLKNRLPGRRVWSAGLHAVVGHGTDATARQIAEQFNLDLSAHRAQQIAGWMCSHADLVLVMEASHQQELEKLYPTHREKFVVWASLVCKGLSTFPTLTASLALPSKLPMRPSPWAWTNGCAVSILFRDV